MGSGSKTGMGKEQRLKSDLDVKQICERIGHEEH